MYFFVFSSFDFNENTVAYLYPNIWGILHVFMVAVV